MAIGATIRLLRKVRGMTQTELAKDANVNIATISRLESGDIKSTSEEALIRIAEKFNLSFDEFRSFGATLEEKEADTLKVGFGHCIWAAPLIKLLMEDGGINGTLLTSYGKRGSKEFAYEPHWYSPEEYKKSGKIFKGPEFEEFNRVSENHFSRVISWNKNETELKVYTADELIRLVKGDELDCIVVPGEIYENYSSELIRAASITYTARGGCHLCIIGRKEFIEKFPSDENAWHTMDPEKQFWQLIQQISQDNPIPVVYSKNTIAEKYYKSHIANIDNITPEMLDLGAWEESKQLFSFLMDANKFFLFICWEPQLSWMKNFVKNYDPGIEVKDYDFAQLNIKERIPYLSFDILFKREAYRKWMDREENKSLVNSFFSTIQSSIVRLSRGKELNDKLPDATIIAQYLNMDRKKCAQALLKLNFRFTYYPEWVNNQ